MITALKLKKFPFKSIMVVGWGLAAMFWYTSLQVTDDRISNLLGEAFGASISIVALYTLTLIIVWLRKIFKK